MLAFNLLSLLVVASVADDANEAKTIDWTFMGTKYTQLRRGAFAESPHFDERAVLKYVQRNSANDLRNVLARNFRKTEMLRPSTDRAYVDDVVNDRVCPFEIRASKLPKIRRIPNAIGIGLAKCGTGTLGFLDCHPNIAFRGTEPRYFMDDNKNKKIIDAWRRNDTKALNRARYNYTKLLPLASRDEYLIEKSPQYIRSADFKTTANRALAMKIVNPNLKLIVYHCDPIKQHYSQLSMQQRRTSFMEQQRDPRRTSCKPCLKGPIEDAMADWTRSLEYKGLSQLRYLLAPWRRVFNDTHIFIVDGERMAHNADGEMSLLLDFLEVPTQTFSFTNQTNKGFSCLKQPLPFCLNPAKGTSRKSNVYELYPDITERARNVIKDGMHGNLALLGTGDYKKQHTDICTGVSERFEWYKPFVCPRSKNNTSEETRYKSLDEWRNSKTNPSTNFRSVTSNRTGDLSVEYGDMLYAYTHSIKQKRAQSNNTESYAERIMLPASMAMGWLLLMLLY